MITAKYPPGIITVLLKIYIRMIKPTQRLGRAPCTIRICAIHERRTTTLHKVENMSMFMRTYQKNALIRTTWFAQLWRLLEFPLTRVIRQELYRLLVPTHKYCRYLSKLCVNKHLNCHQKSILNSLSTPTKQYFDDQVCRGAHFADN